MSKGIVGYGFFKPDALEDCLIDEIINFTFNRGFRIDLLSKCKFTHDDVKKIYEWDWKNCESEERERQLKSNLKNLVSGFSYPFEVTCVINTFKTEVELYKELDVLKGKAYDNPPLTIRSNFKTPFVENMSKEEEVYRISRNRIHLPVKKVDVDNLIRILKIKKIL